MAKPKPLLDPISCQSAACKREFRPIRKWQRFCSGKCRTQDWLRRKNGADPAILDKIRKLAGEIQEICKK